MVENGKISLLKILINTLKKISLFLWVVSKILVIELYLTNLVTILLKIVSKLLLKLVLNLLVYNIPMD